MHQRPGTDSTGRVYRTVKSRIVSCEFTPGDRLDLDRLSREVHASTTPVREAINRLIAEQLIAPGAKKGFVIPMPTEDGIEGLYRLNEILLDASVTTAIAAATVKPATLVNDKVFGADNHNRSEGLAYVQLTRHLFARIASLAMPAAIIDVIENVSDRLSYIRLLESDFVEGAGAELAELVRRCSSAQYEALQGKLLTYHARRRSALPHLLGERLTIALGKKLKASM